MLSDKSALTGYGFGDVFENGADYSPFARAYSLIYNVSETATNTLEITSTTSAACLGDSGGPITSKLPSGEEVLIAVLDSAAEIINHCGSLVNGIYSMKATLVNPYLNLISELLGAPEVVSTPSPVVKKFKITCIKGKSKKYIFGTNPKCPKGYKLIAKKQVGP